MSVTLLNYLALGALLFSLGGLGIFMNRRHLLVVLMSIEIMLLATTITLVAFSRFHGHVDGEIFSLFVLAVAAAEAAIGLAILIMIFREKESINLDQLEELKE